MPLSATKLRQDLYRILDRVLETGVPVEIERRGRKLKIVPENPVDKMAALEPHDILKSDPESIVHVDWSELWNAGDEER